MSYIKNKIKEFGIKLIMSTELKDKENGYIEYNKDTKEFSIIINDNHNIKRQNFTMAHELAHYVLHRDIVIQRGQLDKDSSRQCSDEEKLLEREANIWGANVLMPLQAIKDIIFLKNLDKNNPEHIKQIADRLGVSELALRLQIRNL